MLFLLNHTDQAQEVANAVKLAAAEWNAKGGVLGRKIEHVTRDDKFKPDIGLTMAKELILKENVDLLLKLQEAQEKFNAAIEKGLSHKEKERALNAVLSIRDQIKAREDEARAAEKAVADARERLKAAAAQLVAGLDGIARELDPGPQDTDPYSAARTPLAASTLPVYPAAFPDSLQDGFIGRANELAAIHAVLATARGTGVRASGWRHRRRRTARPGRGRRR